MKKSSSSYANGKRKLINNTFSMNIAFSNTGKLFAETIQIARNVSE